MNIIYSDASSADRWREFVHGHKDCANSHRWEWKEIIENSFGWQSFYLMAEEHGRIRGILPLFLQKSWLLGRWISSMPLLQGGGIVAEDPDIAARLFGEASAITQRVGAKYLELRHGPVHSAGLVSRTDKVKAVLSIDKDPQNMWGAFGSKLRNLIRKAERAGLTAEFGGIELLGDFYAVFSENMRDLGTPVYGPRFFAHILEAFPNEAVIGLARFEGRPIACNFLLGFRQTMESAWAASIRKYLPQKPNMFLHWNAFRFAAQRGYRIFDFGRSTAGSGAHRYKMQWGSDEIPLRWSYWSPRKEPVRALDRHNPKLQFAIIAWRWLPLSIANRVGPALVKHLPS